MLEFVQEILSGIEASIESGIEASIEAPARASLLARLRRELGLDDFGELMISMPLERFPQISRLLPRMATADVQDQWTGMHGMPLLRQSANFVRAAAYTSGIKP